MHHEVPLTVSNSQRREGRGEKKKYCICMEINDTKTKDAQQSFEMNLGKNCHSSSEHHEF